MELVQSAMISSPEKYQNLVVKAWLQQIYFYSLEQLGSKHLTDK